MLNVILSGFSPLKMRNFRIYMSGQVISLIGTWLQVTAQGWVVWELSHSEAALGVVSMLGSLPLLFLGPWAGVMADRWNRRILLIVTQVGLMVLAFVLAALVQTGLVQLWHVYLLSLLGGLCTVLDFPAQQTFLGDMAGMSEVRKAINMNAIVFQISRMIGPALAGLMIARLGLALAFWLNGISFLAVIASLVLVTTNQVIHREHHLSIIHDLLDGVRFLRSQPRLQDLLILTVLVTFLGLSILNIMPSVAGAMLNGDAATLGALLSASGGGALFSAVILMPIAQSRKRAGLIMISAVIWQGVWFLVLGQTRTLPLAMLALAFFSLGVPMVIAMALGLIQVLTPPAMRARVVSLFTMVTFGAQPLSALAVGWSAEMFSVDRVIQINGLIFILGGLAMLLFRRGLKEWVATPHEQ